MKDTKNLRVAKQMLLDNGFVETDGVYVKGTRTVKFSPGLTLLGTQSYTGNPAKVLYFQLGLAHPDLGVFVPKPRAVVNIDGQIAADFFNRRQNPGAFQKK